MDSMNFKSSSDQQPILLLSNRPWNSTLAERVSRQLERPVEIISSKTQLTSETVSKINPKWIFVPHWSHIVPESIWGNWQTVIFHMTDLPYGRGGSPLQNLIQRGHTKTVITALRCCKGLDTGDVYIKEPLGLHGSAEEIFLRADELIEKMIKKIVLEKPCCFSAEPLLFRRRTPPSNLSLCPEATLSAW